MEHYPHASTPVLILISFVYAGIAIDFYRHVEGRLFSTKASTAFSLLMFIFIFCMLAGYASNLLPDGPYKWYLREAFHWFDLLFAFWYLSTRQVHHIGRLLKDE